VLLEATVDGGLTTAGGEVTLGKAGRITGSGWLTGRSLRVNGPIERQMTQLGP
jgi:hypothetical protein